MLPVARLGMWRVVDVVSSRVRQRELGGEEDSFTPSLIVGLWSWRASEWSKFVFGNHPIGQRGDPIDYRKGHGVAVGGPWVNW